MIKRTITKESYLRGVFRDEGEVGMEGFEELWRAWREAVEWGRVAGVRSNKLKPVFKEGRWRTAGEWMSVWRSAMSGRGSGFRGVRDSGRKARPWRVYVGGQHGGHFTELEDAVRAADRLARKIWGPNALVNWPDH